MIRKSKVQYDASLSMLSTSDIFKITSSETLTRLTEFFNALQSLQVENNEVLLERAKEKWADFHRKLCDHENRGVYLNCFLNSVLRCDNAFRKYNLFVFKIIVEGNLVGKDLFELLDKESDQTELIRALKENCQNVPTKVTYKYLHVRVLPAIFSPETNDEERQELCSLVLALPMGFAVQHMHKDTQQKYKQDVMHTYIPYIYKDAITFRRDWMSMCKTLIHYSGKMLHCDTHLQNAILKIMEDGFKSACVEDRCSAFDCWQTLLDNYALERKYLMHPKQTALLLKPLRARISRNRVVAAKKFDTHVRLLQTVRFAKDLLEKFLIDAFGPFELEVPDSLRTDAVQHIRDLNAAYPKSTEILLKVLAHDKNACGCANKTLPITDSCGTIEVEVENWEVLVHSVRLCAQLNYITLVNARKEISETITKCLWSSLFKYIQQEKFNSSRRLILKAIQLAIAKVLNCSSMCQTYYETFFKHILTCLVDYLEDGAFNTTVYEELVLPTIKELIIFQNNFSNKLPANVYTDSVKYIFDYCKGDPNFYETVNCLKQFGSYTCQLAADVFGFALQEYSKTMRKEPNKVEGDLLKNLLIRVIGINCIENISPPDFSEDKTLIGSNSIVLIEVFNKLKKNKTKSVGLLKICSALLRNVVTNKTITDLFFYNYLLDAITNSISEIAKEQSDHSIALTECTNILKQSFESIINARRHNAKLKIETAKLLLIYVELLKLKMYQLLDSLLLLLDFVIKQDVPRELYNLITSLTDYEEEVSQKSFKIFAKIHSTGANFTSPPVNGKSTPSKSVLHDNQSAALSPKVRIISDMVIPAATSIANSVRLFGQYFESPSPKRCRGSVLERTKNSVAEARSPSSVSLSTLTSAESNVRAIEDFSTSEFVMVDKKVVLDKDKMSEKQREKTTKRREDIPALYQDLTQSQSMTAIIGKFREETIVNTVEVRVTRSSELSPKNLLNVINGHDQEEAKVSKEKPTENGGANKDEGLAKANEILKPKRGRKRKVLNANSTDGSPQSITSQTPKKACVSRDNSVSEEKSLVKQDVDVGVTEEQVEKPENEAEKSAILTDRKGKVIKELNRLKMDILGGNTFQNLPRARSRRSRCPDAGSVDYLECPELLDEASNASSDAMSTKGDKKLDKDKSEKKGNLKRSDSEKTDESKKSHKRNSKVNESKEDNTMKIDKPANLRDVEEDKDKQEKTKPTNKKKGVAENQNISQQSEGAGLEQNDLKNDSLLINSAQTKGTPESTIKNAVKDVVMKETESESIIPSSQECNVRVNLFRLPHYSPTKKELEDAKNRNEKAPLLFNSAVVSKIDFSCFENISEKNIDLRGAKDKSSERRRSTNDKSKIEHGVENDETLTLDMAAEVPDDGNIADMDTASFLSTNISMHLVAEQNDDEDEPETSTPSKARLSVSSLEASPITQDTPLRTKELLDNTLDISPIKTATGGVATAPANGRVSPDLFGSQATQEAEVPLISNDVDVENNEEIQAYFKPEENTATLKQPSSRSAKLLTLIGQPAKMSPARSAPENNSKVTTISSPSTNRIRKMMRFCADSKPDEKHEFQKMNMGDVLEFGRAVPSPLALPKTSILKRKFQDTAEESSSPCAKRKRVNFPDPPTTCEKVYFKVIEEKDKPIALRKKKRFVTRLLTQEAEPAEKEAEPSGEDASDAIQSMQNQIDELEFEGVAPLVSSPPKEHPLESGRLSPLPSNPAPEVLGECLPTSYADLFPSEEEPAKSPPKKSDDNESFVKGVFQLARSSRVTDAYLNLALEDIPNSVLKRWMKERESKQRKAKRRRQRRID